jgi:hypothetical protein
MEKVFRVNHLRVIDSGNDYVKLIGIFSTREEAERAVARHKTLPGFSNFPDRFEIEENTVNTASWTSGFFTVPG